jgi:anaerobic selenocysteine-containing dehydrogenase
VELSEGDADAIGVHTGDFVRVESRRGSLEGRVHVGHGRTGTVFVPFHYGWWDTERIRYRGSRRPSAANVLTPTEWDPVSKQPILKMAAVRVSRVT